MTTTPWQTVGPFFHYALPYEGGETLVHEGVEGQRITLEGQVFDGTGAPVTDALIEIWQANAHGRYNHPEDRQDKPLDAAFSGFGRTPTDDEGRFRFHTVKPGAVPGPGNSLQAPHINVTILARGVLKSLVTRVYFADEKGNDTDPVLALVPAGRQDTLIAKPAGNDTYRWKIVLQGDGETVFFDA